MPASTEHEPTVESARAAADAGELEDWIRAFLAEPGSDNEALGDQLADRGLLWHGPVRLPFDELHRLAGPPDQPTVERFDEEGIEQAKDMKETIEDGWEPAPLIATIDHVDQLMIEDGNHRIEALRRAGRTSHWCIVGFADEDERDRLVPTLPVVEETSANA